MNQPQSHHEEVAASVYCIDTGLYRPNMTASYLVRAGERLAFIDTGTAKATPRLLASVSALGLTPEAVDYVIPTHVHLDHAGAAGDLMAHCPNARLVIHPKGADHMIDPSKLVAGAIAVYGEEEFARHFGTPTPIPEERVMIAEDRMVIDLNGRPLTFIDTPGHTKDHGCILDTHTQGLFTGDAFCVAYSELRTPDGFLLFAPSTPVGFDPDVWHNSLDKLMGLDPQVIYLGHYGRVDDPRALEEPLRRSICDLTELALAEKGNEQAGRNERLRRGVTELLLTHARRQGCTLDKSRIREILAVEIDLNAQGLAVWLERRAARIAEGGVDKLEKL